MRIPLASTLESRDGDLAHDAKVVNGIVEVDGDKAVVRKRPGVTNLGQVHSGTAQLLADFYGLRVVMGDSMYSGSLSSIIGASGTSLTTAIANAPMQYSVTAEGAATPRMVFKNRTNAWTMVRAGTISSVSYGATMGSYTWNLASLTRSSSTMTATVTGSLTLEVGDTVTIAGSDQSDYNGAKTVTAVTAGSYTPARVIPITVSRSGTTATATTVSGNHGLTTATAYTIAGANESAYNGSKTITKTGDTTFTYTVTETAATTRTWNSADKTANIALSGSDLIATATGGGLVRATAGKSSGKWYWEITVGTSSGGMAIGVCTSGPATSATLGVTATNYSLGYFASGSVYRANSSGSSLDASLSSYTTADVIGLAMDVGAGTLGIYKNGTLLSTVTSADGTTLYPAWCGASGATDVCTVNFGATAFTHSAPTGYSAFQSTTPDTPATGTITITDPAVTVNPTFTFTQASAQATPATGTITAAVTGGTVLGLPYINGYFSVMDLNCNIYSSALDDPTSWPALNVVIAQNEPGAAVALAKSGNYLVALKEWSTEYFYDAKNATGSPFSPVENGFTLVGCANASSLASSENAIVFVGQSRKHSGKGVYAMSGLEQVKISTPAIDRILEEDTLTNVRAICVRLTGHRLYLLSLIGSDITLAYDFDSKAWTEWNLSTLGSSVSVTSITRSGDIATVTTGAAHNASDGDPVIITGATETQYNGIKQAFVTSSTTYTFKVYGDPPTTASGTILSWPYTTGRLPIYSQLSFDGAELLLLESGGYLYEWNPDYSTDDSNPIDLFIRTKRIDGGSSGQKKCPSIGVVGDQITDVCAVRYSDDDCGSFSAYKLVDLSDELPETRRCGSFRKRTFELRHVGNTSPVLDALEIGE